MRRMTRAAFRALDSPLLATEHDATPTVTAVKRAVVSVEALRKELTQRCRLAIAGGQKKLKGKIFRVGHMGYCSPADVLQYISIMEVAHVSIGKNIELGKGTKAAQEI